LASLEDFFAKMIDEVLSVIDVRNRFRLDAERSPKNVQNQKIKTIRNVEEQPTRFYEILPGYVPRNLRLATITVKKLCETT
jgi:hypothetical protein